MTPEDITTEVENETKEGKATVTVELSIEELKQENARLQQQAENKVLEADRVHKKLQAFEKAEADRKTAALSEIDKEKEKVKAAEAERETLVKANRKLTLQRDIENKVRDAKLEFKSSLASQDAFHALEAMLGEDEEMTDEHIKTLVKERDYLFRKAESNVYSNDAGAKGKGSKGLTKEQIALKKQTISPL